MTTLDSNAVAAQIASAHDVIAKLRAEVARAVVGQEAVVDRLVIALLIVRSAFSLLSETVGVLMEAAPYHIDVDTVRAELEAISGVEDVHDLHVWTITSGMDALSGHIKIATGTVSRDVLVRARGILRERFRIDHVTLQIEEIHDPDS